MLPSATLGPEIVQAPPEELRAYPFTGEILAQLPSDVTLATDDDVRAVVNLKVDFRIPDACSTCHESKGAEWAIAQLARETQERAQHLVAQLDGRLGLGERLLVDAIEPTGGEVLRVEQEVPEAHREAAGIEPAPRVRRRDRRSPLLRVRRRDRTRRIGDGPTRLNRSGPPWPSLGVAPSGTADARDPVRRARR